MSETTVLPLINSIFIPGDARKTVANIEDEESRKIAQAELYYFSGQAEECCKLIEPYLSNPRIDLQLSACLLYTFSNLTLGRVFDSHRGLREIQHTCKEVYNLSDSAEDKALCLFAGYLSAILLHLSIDHLPDFKRYARDLPYGIRIFASYMMAHAVYLKGDYGQALGICQSAFFLTEDPYPISMVYLYCMIAMCEISQKHQNEAIVALKKAWLMAEKDKFLEPFIEHHGLLQGLLEATIRKSNPKLYKRISQSSIAFSRGWMTIHNHESKSHVTDALTTMEFSIAMLACRNWSNQEIGDYLGISLNTVKHYLSDIFMKLDVSKRDKLKEYVL